MRAGLREEETAPRLERYAKHCGRGSLFYACRERWGGLGT